MRNGRNGATDFLAMFKRLVCLRIQQRIAFLHFKDELTFMTVSLEDEHLRSEATLRIKNQYSKFTINFFPKFTAAIFLFTKNKFLLKFENGYGLTFTTECTREISNSSRFSKECELTSTEHHNLQILAKVT